MSSEENLCTPLFSEPALWIFPIHRWPAAQLLLVFIDGVTPNSSWNVDYIATNRPLINSIAFPFPYSFSSSAYRTFNLPTLVCLFVYILACNSPPFWRSERRFGTRRRWLMYSAARADDTGVFPWQLHSQTRCYICTANLGLCKVLCGQIWETLPFVSGAEKSTTRSHGKALFPIRVCLLIPGWIFGARSWLCRSFSVPPVGVDMCRWHQAHDRARSSSTAASPLSGRAWFNLSWLEMQSKCQGGT